MLSAAVLFVGTVVVYLTTDFYTAQEAVAFGTLFLALITAITAYSSQQQTKYMREQVEFMRRPELSIHYESLEGGSGWFVLENTGQVPIEVTIQVALTPVRDTDSDDSILDETVPYDDLPDKVKANEMSGDWSHHREFLEPGQKQKYSIGVFSHELRRRDSDYGLETYHWLRIDGKLTSKLSKEDTREFQRLYMYAIDDSPLFSSYSFYQARSKE